MDFQDFNSPMSTPTASSPLSKRRRFTPNSLPFVMANLEESGLANHVFNSPLIMQLCEQAPTPEEIEASLLQVGMRIRKSVSEGYKNSPQKKFTPRPFFNVQKLSPETQQALMSGNITDSSELSPYYAGGMHNVGAMAMQPVSTATFCGINLAVLSHCSNDWSCPSVKEQSLWSQSNSHKRSYEADSDSDDSQEWLPRTPILAAEAGYHMPVDYFNIGMDDFSDISPLTQPGDQMRSTFNGRRMAKARSRMRQIQIPQPPTSLENPFASIATQAQPLAQVQEPSFTSITSFGQFEHQGTTSCGMEIHTVNDFAEAPFLQKREDVEMDCS